MCPSSKCFRRINHAIFQNVEMLQNNIASVTNHIRRKLTEQGETDIDRKVLTFVKADGGKTYWHDRENYWRIMVFIPRAKTYETVIPIMPVLLSVISRQNLLTFPKHWVRLSPTSITWNSA